jgi:hypothetical protein
LHLVGCLKHKFKMHGNMNIKNVSVTPQKTPIFHHVIYMVVIHYDIIRERSRVRVLTTILYVIIAAYLTPYMAIITEIIPGSRGKYKV